MSGHGTDQVLAIWQQQVGAAKAMWGKLTDDELLAMAGERQKLAGLIKERYAITREAADQQVHQFFEMQKAWLPPS